MLYFNIYYWCLMWCWLVCRLLGTRYVDDCVGYALYFSVELVMFTATGRTKRTFMFRLPDE